MAGWIDLADVEEEEEEEFEVGEDGSGADRRDCLDSKGELFVDRRAVE